MRAIPGGSGTRLELVPNERYLLDSNIFDKLSDDESIFELAERLVECGRVDFLSTHVQADEIERTPDRDRVRRLLSVPAAEVSTYGFVVGYSRVGMARLSDPEPFESLRGDNLDHTEDALIAATSEYEDATLVTEDRQLRSRAIRQGIDVIGWSELRDRLHEL